MSRKLFVEKLYAQEDEVLTSIAMGLQDREMPQISVPPLVGKILYMLVKMSGAQRILEIGGLGGYSTIWMARGLPTAGKLLSLELEPTHAAFARENIDKAGLSQVAEVEVGDAKQLLQILESERKQFDFFFIDADKEGYPYYLEKALQLSTPGAIIAFDNMFIQDRLFVEEDKEPDVEGIRRTHQLIAEDDRLDGIALPLADGLAIARVK